MGSSATRRPLRRHGTRLSDSAKASVGERIDRNRVVQLVPEMWDARPRIAGKVARRRGGIDVRCDACDAKGPVSLLIKIATNNENSDSALKIKDNVDKKDDKKKIKHFLLMGKMSFLRHMRHARKILLAMNLRKAIGRSPKIDMRSMFGKAHGASLKLMLS